MPAYTMLVSMAIADAYGSAFENIPQIDIPPINKLKYRKHPKWNLGDGHYTDDTQMSIALSEFLLSKKSRTAINLADYFVKAYKRDSRPGYMPGFRSVLEKSENGFDFLNTIIPFSKKSGGAMRAAPMGLQNTAVNVIDMAMWQASLTHSTKEGLDSAAASALLVWLCRNGCPRDRLGHHIDKYISGYNWGRQQTKRVSVDGVAVVKAAITAISYFDNTKDILRLCIAFSGDTDTSAAVALAAASMHPDVKQNLPENLGAGLEKGRYGIKYLEDLDWKLLNHYNIKHPHLNMPDDYKKPIFADDPIDWV